MEFEETFQFSYFLEIWSFPLSMQMLIIWVFQLNYFNTVWIMCIYSTSYFHTNFTLTHYVFVVAAENW